MSFASKFFIGINSLHANNNLHVQGCETGLQYNFFTIIRSKPPEVQLLNVPISDIGVFGKSGAQKKYYIPCPIKRFDSLCFLRSSIEKQLVYHQNPPNPHLIVIVDFHLEHTVSCVDR